MHTVRRKHTLTPLYAHSETKASVPPEPIEWSAALDDVAFKQQQGKQLEQERQFEESIIHREMEFRRLMEGIQFVNV